MIDQYLGKRVKLEEGADVNGFEGKEEGLFNKVLAEMREMSKKGKNADYRIQATGKYNPEDNVNALYPGKKIRRLSIIFPTRRTKDPAIEDAEHPEKRYLTELDKAFPK